MSAEDGFDLSQHIISIQTYTKQHSQLIESFNSRLTSLENAMKNCQSLLHNQQTTNTQLLNRIQSLEQKIKTNNNKSPSIETIPATQLEENPINTNTNNINNENESEYELEEMDLKLTNNSTHSHIISQSQPLIVNNNRNNIINIPQINNNLSMPILEQETQLHYNKENISQSQIINANNNDTVLQLFGLQTQTQIQSQNSKQLHHSLELLPTEIETQSQEQLCDTLTTQTQLPQLQNNNNNISKVFTLFSNELSLAQNEQQKGKFQIALKYYTNGFNILQKYNINNFKLMSSKNKQLISIGYCNMAICCSKLNKHSQGLLNLNECVLITPNYHKIYSTMGGIYGNIYNYNQSIKSYKKAIHLCNDINVKNKLKQRLKIIIDKQNDNNNSKKRKKLSWDESPAKRRKLDVNEIRNRLNNKTIEQLEDMLRINGQSKSGTKEVLIECIMDGMLNGITPKCRKCKCMCLEYDKSNGYYKCNGYFDVETNRHIACDFYSNDIVRKPWVRGEHSD